MDHCNPPDGVHGATSAIRRAFARFYRCEPAFTVGALFLLALMLPTALAALIDDRTLEGVDIWAKPLKFELALALYLLTLALYARWLPPGLTATAAYRAYAGVVVMTIAAETTWIAAAAAYGTASHFNDSTPTLASLYGVMRALAALLTSASAVYAIAIARDRQLVPAARTALVLGLGLVLPLTLVTAGVLAENGGHWVGGERSDASGLPLLGWSRDGGDLRVAHFFAVHAMHFVPAFGLLSIWAFGPDRRWPVVGFAALYVGWTAFVFMQALAGRPFLA